MRPEAVTAASSRNRERGTTMAFTGLGGWVTNSPEAAKKLQAADRRYELAKVRMQGMTLGEKIEAQRAAKTARQAEYDAVMADA